MTKLFYERNIHTLMEQKRYKEIKELISEMKPIDVAGLFEDVPEEYVIILFRIIPKDIAAEAFVDMDSDQQEMLISSFTDSELRHVVNELYIDDMVDIVEEMPANVVKRILLNAQTKRRTLINEILKYPKDSAGTIMTTEFISLRSNMTIGEAIEKIRREGIDSETIDVCYVTDQVKHLIGTIAIRTIIISDEKSSIGDLMDRNVISVPVTEDQESVVNVFAKYNLTVIPVVDQDTRLVGIVTIDDALDVLQEETTEDIELMAAIRPTYKPYLKKSTYEIWKSRIPWLLFLMISATFTGMVIHHYETALATYVVLMAYVPMLMDTGGNSGSQSSVTVIRSMSLHELDFDDLSHVAWKEFRVAVMCGLTLAVVNFFKLILLDKVSMTIAAIVCITLALTVLIAKLMGCILPMVTKKIGVDPAVMASPLITTVVDTLSLIIYFKVASVMLAM